jgi:hypothetical protein
MRSIRGIKNIMLVLVSLITAFTFACKKADTSNTFNIAGDWFFDVLYSNNVTNPEKLSCKGAANAGEVYLYEGKKVGSYTVDGTKITIITNVYTNNPDMGYLYTEYHGSASDDNHMSGAAIAYFTLQTQINYIGTWAGTRE